MDSGLRGFPARPAQPQAGRRTHGASRQNTQANLDEFYPGGVIDLTTYVSGTVVVGQIIAIPQYFDRDVKIDALAMRGNANQAAANMRVGVYENIYKPYPYPGRLLCQTASASFPISAGNQTWPNAFSFRAGQWYWFAMRNGGTNSGFPLAANVSSVPQHIGQASITAQPNAGLAVTLGTTTDEPLPSPFPNAAAGNGATQIPLVFYKTAST